MAAKPKSGVLQRLESEVTCPLCLDIFTEPKRLPCDHVYCRQCLRGLALRSITGSISCPECRADTPVPPNSNFAQLTTPHQVNRLIEMYQQNLKLADVETEAVPPQPAVCREHNSQTLALYCETCERLVCRDCVIDSCSRENHNYGFIDKMVKKYQVNLQKDLQPVRALHQQMLTAMDDIAASVKKLEKTTEAKLGQTRSIFDDLAKIAADERQYVEKSIRKSCEEQKKISLAKKNEISAIVVKLESVMKSTNIEQPDSKFLGSVATTRANIKSVVKEAGNISQRPTELPQREAELLSPARFKEICSSSNFTYTDGDPVKGHFERSFDPHNLTVKKTSTFTLHIDPKNSSFKDTPFRKYTAKARLCYRDGTSEAVAVKKITPEQYSLSFVPQKRGRHELHVMYNDTHICGSPIPVYITIQPQQLKDAISIVTMTNSGSIKCYGGKVFLTSHDSGDIYILDSSTRLTEKIVKLSGVNEILVTQEHIYAGDVDRHRVVKMDRNGTIIKSAGGEGNNPGQFNFPNGIRQSKNKEIYVCDGGNHRIKVFDEDLNLIRIIGEEGESEGFFKSPDDLDFDEAGNIYVVEQENHRIQVLTPEGQHIRYIGRPGANLGELNNPVSAAIHRNMIYVTEADNERISVFTLTGEFVTTFGDNLPRPECIAIDEDGYIHITCNKEGFVIF